MPNIQCVYYSLFISFIKGCIDATELTSGVCAATGSSIKEKKCVCKCEYLIRNNSHGKLTFT